MVRRTGGLKRAIANRIAEGLDQRYQLSGALRKESSHVFPKHHSFLWGELALYSFVVLVLSGTFLALFFVPDTSEVVYTGPYEPLRGLHASRAYQSALKISFEVRGGLFIRQLHHWAALVFVATIVLHMARNFFTGAFRKPREFTWLTGVALLMISLVEGYTGYSMLDDLLSGIGVRIISGLLLSVPVVGTWLHWLVFGGEFEGDIWISRFFVGHVFLLPGLLFALIAVHLALVWYQKHTQFPGPGARESNVVGDRTAPGFGGRTLANGICVLGVLALLGAFFQINPIFLWGPYTPAQISTGVQPDWYIAFFIGALRLFPPWSIHLGPYTIPAPFWPGLVLPLLMFLLLAIHPFYEQWSTKDRRRHHLLQRPRDNPVRTGLGAMALTFYLVLFIAGGDDIHAIAFNIPFEWFVWGGRIGLLLLPPLAYVITHRICRGLQRADRDTLERGIRTGLLRERRDGVFVEVRQPPGGVDHEDRPVPMEYGGARVDRGVAARAEGDERPE
ncbi:cytochrome bc1 complex cytochrome b subunit [Haloactinomyces albus]|uniref:Cytochrome bc1 complex cytochrome b subunit n=1 Tax=Haloactinomyces albus TaxID=1352928 RepID=A0AAE3ZCP4_9ACTN|nr:cytochrome bc complex cytochrome b subunit [Haloactinomyces albus]MDR7301440.1 ubiquinol-cytochrome c reductase cytochrome b subunit [Haloactinomyces albus]